MIFRPEGWTRRFLETQLKGLTGHMEEAGYPFDTVCWGEADFTSNNDKPQWWVYEQTAYWLDGMTRCAILLQDEEHLKKAGKILTNVLDQADEDGYLGPKFLKAPKAWNRWPHVVFFRALMAWYEYTKDPVILQKMEDHYLKSPADYSVGRDVINVEIMLWLYGKTGNRALLSLAEESYREYNQKAKDDLTDAQALSEKKPYAHGVSYNEYFKLGAILYRYTKDPEYLKVSLRAYDKLDHYFLLPSGCICSNEFLLNDDYMQSSETCDVSDYTWGLSYLMDVTGEGSYGDTIEQCIFNAGVGAVLENFKALQYFSCANQILCDTHSNHNRFHRGSQWMSYRPNPGTECCPGNVNRFMPNFLWNSWRVDDDGVYHRMFSPGTMEAVVNHSPVSIQVKTNYPFSEKIRYHITCKQPFFLWVRCPAWCDQTRWSLNGVKIAPERFNGFFCIPIEKSSELVYEMHSPIKTHLQKEFVWFSKGPLVYSMGMKGIRKIDREEPKSSKKFPAYNIYPDEQWRYCLLEEPTFIPGERAAGFDLKEKLPYLEVKAAVIDNWTFDKRTKIRNCYNLYEKKYNYKQGEFVFTPRLRSNKSLILQEGTEQTIRLYPYGACKLRMTVLNQKIPGMKRVKQ